MSCAAYPVVGFASVVSVVGGMICNIVLNCYAGTDRSNIVQIANRDENFPMPFDQTNMWENAEIVWSPYKLNNNQNPSAQDLAINMASSGYYR